MIETTQTTPAQHVADLRAAWKEKGTSFLGMPWQQFEDEIAVFFSELGYQVDQTGRTGDGGFDGTATKDGHTYLYECKAGQQIIGRPHVQKFESAVRSMKADGGLIINTGTFSRKAKEYAEQMNVTLIGCDEFSSDELVADERVHIGAKIPVELFKRLEAYQRMHHNASRATVIEDAITLLLDREEFGKSPAKAKSA